MSQATVLLADDDNSLRTVLNKALAIDGYKVRATSNATTLWKWVSEGEGDIVVTDVVMPDENAFELLPRIRRLRPDLPIIVMIPRIKSLRPDLPIIVMSAQNTVLTAITATERGAYDYLPKPFDLNELTSLVRRALQPSGAPKQPFKRRGNTGFGSEALPIIGRSAAMQDVYRIIARLTATDLTVMISGESGTGKELVARVLHDYGKRRERPFVAVNMAAIPREQIESELFGQDTVAHDGTPRRSPGRFAQAFGGTLFLDEIGDMPFEAQTRLLRVLQEGEYTSVGGSGPIKTDVRIVAATNKNLTALIDKGLFREDLFFRLNVVPLRLPPLRERLEDVPDLTRHFLAKAQADSLPAKTIQQGALEQLMDYGWPGNVRELENVIRRICAIYSDEAISAEIVREQLAPPEKEDADREQEEDSLEQKIGAHLDQYFAGYAGTLPPDGIYDRILKDFEKPLIEKCLDATRGNQLKAAALLGLNRNTLRKKIRDLKIDVVRGSRVM